MFRAEKYKRDDAQRDLLIESLREQFEQRLSVLYDEFNKKASSRIHTLKMLAMERIKCSLFSAANYAAYLRRKMSANRQFAKNDGGYEQKTR